MIGFEGRLQWRRHKLFKLCAKLLQCEKHFIFKWLVALRRGSPSPVRTKNLRFAYLLCDAQ